MPDAPELRSLVDAAAQATAAGDYASAEQLLREAARLPEASLGPLHPDLANTLNNLGIVCKLTGKPVDAERGFRQTLAIAAAALAPDHPFVTTSRKNLEDYCVPCRPKPWHEPPPGDGPAHSRSVAASRVGANGQFHHLAQGQGEDQGRLARPVWTGGSSRRYWGSRLRLSADQEQ